VAKGLRIVQRIEEPVHTACLVSLQIHAGWESHDREREVTPEQLPPVCVPCGERTTDVGVTPRGVRESGVEPGRRSASGAYNMGRLHRPAPAVHLGDACSDLEGRPRHDAGMDRRCRVIAPGAGTCAAGSDGRDDGDDAEVRPSHTRLDAITGLPVSQVRRPALPSSWQAARRAARLPAIARRRAGRRLAPAAPTIRPPGVVTL
jgi:hypothetical protein